MDRVNHHQVDIEAHFPHTKVSAANRDEAERATCRVGLLVRDKYKYFGHRYATDDWRCLGI